METKSAFKSLTVWGVVISAVCSFIHNRTGVNVADQVPAVQDATAGIVAGFQTMAPAIGQLAGAVMVLVGRFRATQPLHIIPPTATKSSSAVGGVSIIGLAGVGLLTLTLVGCAGGTIPAQFNSPPAATPLSATDTKIVQQLANIDTAASLATIETSSATLTSIGMYVGIQQSATMAKDGLLLNGIGLAMQSPAAGALPTSTSVGSIVAGLGLSASDQQSAVNFSTLGQSLNGVVGLINTQIRNLAAQTNNPSVGAYAVKVGEDVTAAVGKGICDATNQYVTATATTTAFYWDGAEAARVAHNHEAGGSSPSPSTLWGRPEQGGAPATFADIYSF